MPTGIIRCGRCHAVLPPGVWNTRGFVPCPCGASIQIDAYPALTAPILLGVASEAVVVPDQATCFYHPNKKAAVPCDHCGRFLCTLCDVDFDGQHLCPKCIERGKKDGRLGQLHSEVPLYDSIALALAVWPMIFPFLTCLTAPATLYYAIRYWKAPTSLLGRTKARFIVAIVLAGLQILAWPILIYLYFWEGLRL